MSLFFQTFLIVIGGDLSQYCSHRTRTPRLTSHRPGPHATSSKLGHRKHLTKVFVPVGRRVDSSPVAVNSDANVVATTCSRNIDG
ncbi:hypothetical protein BDI4_20136 [Burkholderia diffusa]|nr:hypothetical protein BDI4_20136 [Burkholderia diffusa]